MDSTGKGMMTSTSARLVDGASGVFLDIKPFSSVETQQSAETAALLASRKSGASLSGKAVLFSVDANAEIIDGPSGGIGFSLLAYAELTGKRIRGDLAATGTIEQDGSVGKIGGAPQKLDAVREAGLHVFLIPLGQSFEEGVDLVQLGEQGRVQVIEVANFDEAAAIAFTPAGSQAVAPKHEQKELILPAISVPPESQSMRFLAENEVNSLAESYYEFSVKPDNASKRVASALGEALNESRELLAKNYFYSSANAAFVARVAADSFKYANLSKKYFAERVDALAIEMNRSFEDAYGSPKITDSNWEMLAGAQLRYAWASAKARELESKAPMAISPLPFVEDYASALAWLDASARLEKAAEQQISSGGVGGAAPVALNEANGRGEAASLIKAANASLSSSYDADGEWHLGVAEDSFSRGEYAAAAFDACFALSFSQARAKADGVFGDDFAALFGNASALPGFKSMWAQLYYAHSLYSLAEANRTGDFAFSLNALKLQELAHCVESSSERLQAAMSSRFPIGAATETPSAESAKPSVSASGGSNGVNSPGASSVGVSVVYSVEPGFGGAGGALTAGAKQWFLVAFVVLVALIVLSVLFVRAKLRGREPPLSNEERERKLDDLLLKGRISEAAYERLRGKYVTTAKKAEPRKKRK